MSKMSRKGRIQGTTTKVASNRHNIHKYGLGAGLGIAFGFTLGDAASAHNGASVPSAIPPVMHNHAAVTSPQINWHHVTSAKPYSHANLSTSSLPSVDNLNLVGTSASYSASLLGNFSTLTIDVGGKADVVKMSSKLTNAELVAADQVLNGGIQTLSLNARGAAAGGSLNLNGSLLTSLDNALGGSITSITIPKHVTLNDSVSNLNLSGDLTNYGSLISQSGAASGNTINAASITNAGSISAGKTDLTLNAAAITNTGTIASGTNVNLGSGVINSAGGTISAGHTINVNNPGGIAIAGGNMLSQTLNLNAGNSALNVNGTNITGVVNDTAGSAHINATSQNFLLGNSNVSGDPLFSNTGNFTITGAVSPTGGNDLSIVAGGSIFSGTGARLDTSNAAGNGGNLLLVAGANFTVDPTTGNLTITQSSLANGGSATGGTINLSGSQAGGAPIVAINTNSTQVGGTGGNVTMVAYGGSAAGSGTILVPNTVTIKTGNDSTATGAGNVEVIAGATKSGLISLGNIDVSGGISNASVLLSTSTPLASAGGVVIGNTGTVIGGNFAPSAPLAVQSGNIVVGNITANSFGGTAVTVESGGAFTFKNIDASGYGGAAGTLGVNGGAGGSGGGVVVTAAGAITGGNILSFGGGGGGGGGGVTGTNGRRGGAGGFAGGVSLTTTSGNIALSGEINASGGSGGGGGGGGSNGAKGGGSAAGVGGANGVAAQILLSTEGVQVGGIAVGSTKGGSINAAQGMFAINGVAGGKGLAGDNSGGTAAAGGGGGGGGAYGGGGGGGGGGQSTTAALSGGGGGGGGGYWGGGGGDSGATQNGASGGGAGLPGTAGPAGTAGGQFTGGNGAAVAPATPAKGGSFTFGTGGQGGAGFGGNATSGASLVAATGGGNVFITANTGIGTATAAQSIAAPNLVTSAPGGSIFATLGGDTTVGQPVLVSKGGTVSIADMGSLTVNSPITGGTISLSTLPLSNGNINVDTRITGSKSVTLNASGTGAIAQSVVTQAINTPLLVATSGSGNINLLGRNSVSNFQFNTGGALVNLQNVVALNILQSSAGSLTVPAAVAVNALNSPLSISGVVTSSGTANFTAGTSLSVKANVTAPGGDIFTSNNGLLTVTGTLTNNGPVSFTSNQFAIGKVMLNAPQVTISSPGANITDNFTGITTILGALSPLQSLPGALVFNSAGSELGVPNGGAGGTIANYASVTLANTSAAGQIVLGNNAINISNNLGRGNVFLSTVGGNITTLTTATANAIVAQNLAVTTKTGSMVAPGGYPMSINVQGLSFLGSSTLSTVNLTNKSALPTSITAVTANSFTLANGGIVADIGIAGIVSAATINLSTPANILQTATKGALVGTNITLTGTNIGNPTSIVGLTTTMTGAGTLQLNATNAEIASATAITLGNGTVFNDLTLTTKLGVTQSGTLTVGGLAFINGASFTQNAGAVFNGNATDIIVSGKPGAVILGGTTNATSSLSILTSATGTINVNTGAVVDSPAVVMQALTVSLGPQSGLIAPGIIETSTNPLNPIGSISLSNPGGNFSLLGTAGPGLGTIGASANLTITAKGNIVISPLLTLDGTINETITAGSKGTVSLPTNTLTVLPTAGGAGGTINLTAASLLVNGAAPLTNITFNAAATAGTGGTINVTLNGKANATIDATVGDAGALNFNANGTLAKGDGGTVSLTNNGGSIIWVTANGGVNNIPAVNGGNGGNLTLNASTVLNITGPISATPGTAGGSTFGNIALSAAGKSALVIDGGVATGNFVNGTITGANITITDATGVTVGAAGAITINAQNLAPIAPVLTLNTNVAAFAAGATIVQVGNPTALVINSTSNLTFTGVGATSFGAPTDVTVNAKGNVTVPTALLANTENSITLASTATLTLPVNAISVAFDPITGNGGTINITSLKQNFVTPVVGPLALSAVGGAVGGGTNNGGLITYASTGTNAINAGGASSTVTIDVSAGTVVAGTVGGTARILDKGTITLDAGGIKNTAGVLNSVDLESSGGGVVVTAAGSTPLYNIGKGSLILDSNNSSTFSVVTTLPVGGLKNGAVLPLALTVGTFTINNAGGGVSLAQAITANPLFVLPGVFAANVIAKGNITDAFTAGAPVVIGPSISLQSSTGNVGSIAAGKTPAVPFVIQSTNLTGSNISITDGKSGVVNVQDTSTFGDTLVTAAAGTTYNFASAGSIATLAPLTAANVTLNAAAGVTGNVTLGGNLGSGKGIVNLIGGGTLIENIGSVSAASLFFNVGTMATPLLTNATAILVGSQVTGLGNPTINIIDSATKTLTLPALSTTNASGTISIVSAGPINATGNIGGGAFAAQNTTLTAGANSSITEAPGVTITGSNLLTLTSANLTGTAKGSAFLVNTGTLQLNTNGTVDVTDARAGAPVAVQGIFGTIKSFQFAADGPIVLNNINATGAIQVTDTTTALAGGITTNTGSQLISATSITLLSTNTAGGLGAITVNGNAIAPIVTVTSGTNSNINLGGSIGTGTGAVTLNANTGNIQQTNSLAGAVVFASTLNFTATGIFGNTNFLPLVTTATTITQSSTAANTNIILLQDLSTLPVTVTANGSGSSLATSLAGGTIQLTTNGNLILVGSVTPGANGNVVLSAGQSMSLGGSVGIAGAGNNTTITVGSTGLGTGQLTEAASANILGDNITLTSGFPIDGFLGTAGTALTTQATTSMVVNGLNSLVNIANNSGVSAALALTVNNSQALQFANTSTGGVTALTLNNINAKNNGGGAINITNNGALNVGTGAVENVTGNSITLTTTGTGNLTINDRATLLANVGSITATSAGNLTIGAAAGKGVNITSNSGNITLGFAVSNLTGAVTIGDRVNMTTNSTLAGTGNISINSPTTITVNGTGVGLTATTNTFGNITLTAVGNITTVAGETVNLTTNNDNIIVSSTGGFININNTFFNSGGSIGITASGKVNLATGGGDNLTLTTNSVAGLTISGSNITMGNAGAAFEDVITTGGNVAFTSTDKTVTATGIIIGTNGGDPFNITTTSNGANTGNLTITSANAVTIGNGITLSTDGAVDPSSGNITITGIGSSTADVINIEGGTISTNAFGTTSGNITISGNTATGLGILLGSGAVPLTIIETGNSGNVTVDSNKNLTVADGSSINSAQNLSLLAGDGTAGAALVVGIKGGGAAGVTLLTNNGNMILQTDTSSPSGTAGTIEIGNNSVLDTTASAAPNGTITFAVGSTQGVTSSFASNPPAYTVTITGTGTATATVIGAIPGFTVNGKGTAFNVINTAITMFNNGVGAGQILFDGADTITADPPAPAIAPTLPALQNAVTLAAPQLVSTGVTPLVRTSAEGMLHASAADLQTISAASAVSPSSTNTAGLSLTQASTPSNDIFSSLSSLNAMSNLQTYGAIGTAQNGSAQNSSAQYGSAQNSTGTDSSSSYSNAQLLSTGEATKSAAKLLQGAISKKINGGGGKNTSSANEIAEVKELPNGALLLAPEKSTAVVTPFGTVHVAARALALVVATASGLSVYDLDDCHRDSVSVQINDQTISLDPGKHVTVTNQAASGFEHVNPAPYIAYRNVRSCSLNNSLKAYQSEFHHLSAIVGLEPLREMLHTSDARKNKVGNHLLKTVAVLTSLSASSTPYELKNAPSMTALNR